MTKESALKEAKLENINVSLNHWKVFVELASVLGLKEETKTNNNSINKTIDPNKIDALIKERDLELVELFLKKLCIYYT